MSEQEQKKLDHTSLKCLCLIARHHSVDVSVERLVHDYSLETSEPSTRRLLRIAKDAGFRARRTRLAWHQLRRMGEAFPAMAQLKNGNYVILVGLREAEDEEGKKREELAIFDPLADRHDFIFMDRETFQKSWEGDVILMKRSFSMMDKNQPFSLRWFIPEIIRQRVAFIDVAIGALFIHAIALVTPLYFQIVIDKVLVNNAQDTLRTITIGILIAIVFDAILDYLRGFLLLHATSKIDVRVATRTFNHMLHLPIQFFEQMTAGVLTKHMQQTSKIREFLTGQLFMTLLDSTALFVFLPILFFYSSTLSFVVLGFSAALAAVIGVLLGPYRRRLEALYAAEGDRQAMLVESIHGIQTVKALSMEPIQRRNWDEKSAQSVAMHFHVGKISITARSISKLLEKAMTVTLVWVGAMLVFDNNLSVGALVAFQMIAGRVTGPLVQLVSLVHSYQEAALSVRMMGKVMNRPVEPGMGRGLRPSIQGRMEFENVTFHYSPTSPPALDHVSLNIPAGSVVGIVGRSGSGKTTLTRLMQGLYEMQGGLIRFDGMDIREYDLAHLRRNIGVVLQENFLFRGSVRENISMSKTNATFQEVVQASKLAGAAEFIERLPQSFDTILEENGANLSGGQKQRLAIARALLTDPRILIFDEATSALDPESEAIIQANLAKIAKGRTVIIVSHRLSTLTRCDAIVVIERGKIENMGTHQQLLNQSKVYKELWYQQMGRA
ncbi:MAG: peptidase domain-containing ABC transporter [Planctomycetota bacterium]|nr:peptidase domain-containing ABC transporter [Planctomycetota bacterium]